MFTGIIEGIGTITDIKQYGENRDFVVQADFVSELYIDQSIAHNGVCLTVVEKENDHYKVTAVKETLDKTNFDLLQVGDKINLERCMVPNQRLDGHFVQGHVDTKVQCLKIEDQDGSWKYTFALPDHDTHLIVPKGSIAINGTSLTVILDEDSSDFFQVAIIPYTYDHTTIQYLKVGDFVNVEYDILGKYVSRFMHRIPR
jgi:riboflavin synthase